MSVRPSILARGVSMVAGLRRDSTVRAVAVLVGGTASAQAIGLLALPILTRLYTAEDFRLLAIYVALLTLIAPVICLRLETAIPLPEDDREAVNLIVLSLISTVVVTALLTLAIILVGERLAIAAGRPEFAPYLWLVPIGAALAGLYSTFQYLAVRHRAFGPIARSRITQATAGLGTQVALGFAGLTPLGLMVGHAITSGAGVTALVRHSFKHGVWKDSALSWRGLRTTLHNYKRFPKYAVAEEFTNNAGIQLPVLLIGAFLIGPEAGFLFLAMRVVGAPLTIIGGAVSQAYYAHAAEYEREGRLAEETARIFRRLSTWVVLPMVAVGPFAPDVFRIVFGPEWERAGVLIVWMLPWYAFRLVASPISMVMYVKNLQKRLMAYSLVGLVVRTLPILLVLATFHGLASPVYAISSALYYSALLIALMVATGMTMRGAFMEVLKQSLVWLCVGVLAYAVALGVRSFLL